MKLLTVRQAAAHPDCPLSERMLRKLIADGRLPGVKVGNRHMICLEALNEWIVKEALREARE